MANENQIIEELINEMELQQENKDVLILSLPNLNDEEKKKLVEKLKGLVELGKEKDMVIESVKNFEETGEL